jgi:hypothetical protein
MDTPTLIGIPLSEIVVLFLYVLDLENRYRISIQDLISH